MLDAKCKTQYQILFKVFDKEAADILSATFLTNDCLSDEKIRKILNKLLTSTHTF